MQNKKLDSLTALRFFAAALIVLTHADPLFGSFGIASAAPLGQGVSFFFVLSGFILAHTYTSFDSPEKFKAFFIARFARIWPLHVLTCLLWIFLIYHFDRSIYFPDTLGTAKLLANLLLVQAWVPLGSWALSFNGVAWSLSVEFFFYLFFPVLIIHWQRSWHLIIGGFMLIVIGMLAVANYVHLPADDTFPGVGLLGLIFFGPWVRIFEFAIGIGVANLVRNIGPIVLSGSKWFLAEAMVLASVVVAMVAVAVPTGIEHVFGRAADYYVHREGLWIFWAALIGVFALSKGPVSKILSSRPMVFLGELSFALYLIHAVVIAYLDPYASVLKSIGLIGMLGFWAVCLVLAVLLFLGVEQPCRKFILDQFGKRRSGQQASQGAAFGRREVSALAALIVAVMLMSELRPTTAIMVDKTMQGVFTNAAGFDGDGGAFSNGVRVVGIQIQTVDGKTVARVLMTATRRLQLNAVMGVHLNDSSGTILSVPGDFPLDIARTSVDAGAFWMQSIPISPSDLAKASSLALALYVHPPDLLTVVGNRTDWDNRRLLFKIR